MGNIIYTCSTPAIYGIAYNRKKAWAELKRLQSVGVGKTTHTGRNPKHVVVSGKHGNLVDV